MRPPILAFFFLFSKIPAFSPKANRLLSASEVYPKALKMVEIS